MIYIATDHAGFEVSQKVTKFLTEKRIKFEDLGPKTLDKLDDYPDYAFRLAQKTAQEPENFGILVCRSGAGMAISANKVKGIRAVVCMSTLQAKKARDHNNANVLVLAADYTNFSDIKKIITTFLRTPFSNEERHQRRLLKISQFEEEK